MLQSTVNQLYAYWDRVRNGRVAPSRIEINPVDIAPLLAETFIAECVGPSRYRIRLAGTKICNHFGRELRGADVLEFWDEAGRESLVELLAGVFGEGGVGHALIQARTKQGRLCTLEFVLMPLTHGGDAINRGLGAITAIDPPFWLGTEPLLPLQVLEWNIYWPDGGPMMGTRRLQPSADLEALAASGLRVFSVHDGGLDKRD
jgi:hypothetical protein